MFGDMDDDGFYYVRTSGCGGCCTPPHQLFQGGLLQSWGGGEQGFLMDTWRNGQVTSHDRGVELRLFPASDFGVSGAGAAASLLVSISPASPSQGELNGQRGLVPSNFLEGPGPEVGGSDREPGTPQAESQVSEGLGSQLSRWVSTLLVWWWGPGSVVGGPRRAMTQLSIVSRLERLSYRKREPSQGQLPPTRCPALQRGDGCDIDSQPI